MLHLLSFLPVYISADEQTAWAPKIHQWICWVLSKFHLQCHCHSWKIHFNHKSLPSEMKASSNIKAGPHCAHLKAEKTSTSSASFSCTRPCTMPFSLSDSTLLSRWKRIIWATWVPSGLVWLVCMRLSQVSASFIGKHSSENTIPHLSNISFHSKNLRHLIHCFPK